jgi:hypothetical protein
MNKDKQLIENLKSKKWLYNGKPVAVDSHQKVEDQYVFCLSDGTVVKCFVQNLEATLEEKFIPLPSHSQTPAKVGALSDTLVQLKDILMDNIKKVQEDKEYITQAKEVNNSIKEVVNLAKLDIEYTKLSKEI